MTEKEIIPNNKMIADFMGWSSNDIAYIIPSKLPYWVYDLYIPEVEHLIAFKKRHEISYANLRFHESWDWLMPVVEKVEKINDDFGRLYYFTIEQSLVFFHARIADSGCQFTEIFKIGEPGSKIQATYKAVIQAIQFIQNYNKESK